MGDSAFIMMDRLPSSTNHGKQWPPLNGKWIVLVLLVVQEIDLVVTGHCGHPHRHVVVVLSLVAAIVVVIASQSGCSRPGPTGRQTDMQTTGERTGESCRTNSPPVLMSILPFGFCFESIRSNMKKCSFPRKYPSIRMPKSKNDDAIPPFFVTHQTQLFTSALLHILTDTKSCCCCASKSCFDPR